MGIRFSGYVVDELIGIGGSGEVWRGRELATGDTVAVKRAKTNGPASVERLRREAALLASVAGPHVVGLRELVVSGDLAMLVMEHAAGGSLAGILAARRSLPAPEVVTILAPIATALAAAHARDLVHGDLTPANILFTADGRPLLADFGVARALGAEPEPVEGTVEFLDPAVLAGEPPTAAADVFALAAVGYTALAGTPVWGSGTPDQIQGRAMLGIRAGLDEVAPDIPRELVAVIESALALDPPDRPDARTFAHQVLHACAAAPVGLVAAPVPVAAPLTHPIRPVRGIDRDFVEQLEAQPPPVRPRWRRYALQYLAICFSLTASAAVGVLLGHHSGAAPHDLPAPAVHVAVGSTSPVASAPMSASTSAASPRASPVDVPGPGPPVSWLAVVTRLDAARASAFADADPTRLAAVYLPGSAAYSTDLATVTSLVSRGLKARGFTATVDQVSQQARTPTTAQLRVVDRLSGYDLVDDSGAVVGRGEPRAARAFTMWLSRVGGGWRVRRIAPA